MSNGKSTVQRVLELWPLLIVASTVTVAGLRLKWEVEQLDKRVTKIEDRMEAWRREGRRPGR